MKKVAEVTTPIPTPRRGRPPKKHLLTPKSAPAAPGESSHVPQNGTKLSDVQVSSKQTVTSGSLRKNLSIKRNGSRSASVDSSGVVRKKRRQKSPDKAASSSGRTSMPSSRTSSKEKVDTLLSKTVKQEALKVAQSLESSPTILSNTERIMGKLKRTRKKETQPKKFNLKKSQRNKAIKKFKNVKETKKTEIKRLLTTDGFWSSKTSSRSNSPLGQLSEPLSQKQTHSVKKDSRTSTPDLLPLCTKKQSITKIRADKEEIATSKSNIPVSELRRLRTTEGFSFRDSPVVTSVASSRDVSPASGSSLDRMIRQNARSVSRSSENKNGAKSENDPNMVVNDIVQGKPKIKNKKVEDNVDDKLPVHQTETSESGSVNSSIVSGDQTNFETPISRFRKKKKSSTEQPAKQDTFSSHVRGRKESSFVRGFNKSQRLTKTSVLPHSVIGEQNTESLTSTSINTQKVKENVKLTKRSMINRIIKNSPRKNRTGLQRAKHKLKDNGSVEPLKLSRDLVEENTNVPEVGEEALMPDSGCLIKTASSPEFAISDLLGSAELKRLNTTAGFWASTPDIGTVLSTSHPRRLRDTDINFIKGSPDPKQSGQSKKSTKPRKTPVKSQSTLLQHRKKRLHALQNSLRKIKQQISNEELVDQHLLVDSTSTEVAAELKPNPKTLMSKKKRNYKTRSKLNNGEHGRVLGEMHTPKEHYESAGIEVDVKESSELTDLKVDVFETLESKQSETYDKEPHFSSVPETLVTDSLPAKRMFARSWKRGRRKTIPGDSTTLSTNFSGIKTRGRGKVNNSTKSLEVLQNLEPAKDGKLSSSLHDTPKVRREGTKLQKIKKKLASEAILMIQDVPEIDIDKFSPQVINTEGKDIERDQKCCSRTAIMETENDKGEKHATMSRQNSGHKKDNLFESLGYNLLMPSDVPCTLSSNDMSVAFPLNETNVESQVMKSDLPILTSNCDQIRHDVCELETRTSVTVKSDCNNICSNADEAQKLNAAGIKVMVVNTESIEDIPVQTDTNSLKPSYNLISPDPPYVPKSLYEGSVMENTEPNSATSDTRNDIADAYETVHECDPISVQEVISFTVTNISKKENSPLELGGVVNPYTDTNSGMAGLCIENNLECSLSGKDNLEAKDTFSEKVQINQSKDTSSSHHSNIENENMKCVEETEPDFRAGNSTQNVDVMTVAVHDFAEDNQHEQLLKLPVYIDHFLESEKEEREVFVEKTIDFGHGEHNILNSDSNVVHDVLSMVAVSVNPQSVEDKTEDNIAVDISAAPLVLSHDSDVTTPSTIEPSVETAILNQQNKRKKRSMRFFRHSFNNNTDNVSQSAEDVQVRAHILDNAENTSEIIVLEEKISTDIIPNKEHVKKLRKRRRNAWQRGVLKKASKLSRKSSKEMWLLNSEENNTPAPIVNTVIENGSTVSAGLHNENDGTHEVETYSPAIKKSLSNMLKKLKTNANLANAVFVDKPYEGRLLRHVQSQEHKGKQLKKIKKKLSAEHSTDRMNSLSSDNIGELQRELPKDLDMPGVIKRKRGRPKKHRDESFPKLTPLHNLPTLRPVSPWSKTPPDLSPQAITSQSSAFFDTEVLKNTPDTEFVCENVDDTDLHLYLSGVSDEEQSPKKESLPISDIEIQADISVTEVQANISVTEVQANISVTEVQANISVTEIQADISVTDVHADIPVFQEKKFDKISDLENTKEISLNVENISAVKIPTQVDEKEPEKIVKPKLKGRKGCPPGIPMTDEERRKKVQKNLVSSETYEEQDLVESLETSQKSVLISDICDPSVFINKMDTPAAKFSLRKKSTRSPLEMLAMKRKQEEARYDLEQEKRQARLIHLREMRSARESGDGYSDDGDVSQCPENLMLCSVILSDFVKKLQLDDIEASQSEEICHQPADNLSTNGESPEYNGDEEDWCADLEDHESEDRNDNRPYIPRLKLKRVIKKGTGTQNKGPNPKIQQSNERHEPIKLVIKTEPSSEQSEQVGVKSNLFIDSAKVDRSSFESSYMEFLRGKNVSERTGIPKRKHSIPRYTNIVTNRQNTTGQSSAEILTLPVPMNRDSSNKVDLISLAELNKATSVEQESSSLFVSAATSSSYLSNVDTVSCVGMLTNADNLEASKRLSSGDEEDDDILILDLDEGAVDPNSEDTFRDSLPQSLSACQSSSSGQPLLLGNSATSSDNKTVSKENDITSPFYPVSKKHSVDNGLPRGTFRSHSNDEMGLMFESYNNQNDEGVGNQLTAEQNVAVISASSENFKDCSEIGTLSQKSTVSHSVSSILMEGNDVNRKNISDTQQLDLASNRTEDALLSSEANVIGTSIDVNEDTASAVTSITNEALNVEHLQALTEGLTQQFEGENKDLEQILMNKVSGNIEGSTPEETNCLPHLESTAVTLEKAAEETTTDITTLDNNNITQALKPAHKATVPGKKPGFTSDNSRSPKHPTYYDSGPEEWKVKVILQSDKFPSGTFTCKRCGFTTSSKLIIESHVYSHIPGVQFRCAYCESEFSSMAATSSHLKNTHSLSEAKLHISRHIDEKNFYDKESAVFSEENSQHSSVQAPCASSNSEGQSPPLIISVVVSGGVGSTRAGRPSAPPRRFVCTHCGFSTNIKEDAEHHVLDLHSSQSLYACLLCSENVCYTESEIKDHCATVHPARHHPYRKLPDFYDAEQLNLKEKVVSQDDRENIFERMTSIFQDDSQAGTCVIDHKQKAKEYLFLQEGWREKTRVEADSTTAVDYTEEPSTPQTPTQECSIDEGNHQAYVMENEASDHHEIISQAADVVTGNADLSEVPTFSDDAFITSSAGSTIKISSVNSQVVDSDIPSEPPGQQADKDKEETQSQVEEPSGLEIPVDENNQDQLSLHGIEDNGDDSDGMGLKIIQVVSLSGQEEDIVDEQISTDQSHPEELDTDVPVGSGDSYQIVAQSSENTELPSADIGLLESRHSPASTEETAVQKGIQAEESVKDPNKSDAATESSSTDISAAASAVASPSFAGGLPLSYKCNACKVHTPYLLMMVKHLKARHPNMRCFSCPYCKTTHSFVSQKQLRHHVKQSHPNKFGRNEIALSEDAKKFVEAMVLPMGPECIRVGSRIVLEEDIHTCTYCQVKMISLANVYEHLNTKHSDLFEFVCPVCQSFKNKLLTEISEHCLKTHKSSLDTDKVHVSVPKNLFTALTCISKNGKYIEKNLVGGAFVDKTSASSSSATSEESQKTQAVSAQGKVSLASGAASLMNTLTSATMHSPLRLTSYASTATAPAGIPFVSGAQTNQPVFAIPFISTGVPAARTVVAFSSSLFDTSTLATTPHMAIASQSNPTVHNAAASSFLSPLPQPAHLNSPNTQPSKHQSPLQVHPRAIERAHGPAKNLPVLNVPTIKPRTTSLAAKAVESGRKADDHIHADKVPKSTLSTSSSIASLLTTSASHLGIRPTASSSCIDNLPDDEPNPDAFKIFNLRPSSAHSSSSSASPTVSSAVFPPVSPSITPGYLQGPVAGFPPGMVIPSNLLPMPFSFTQHQPLMPGMLAQKHNHRNSPLSRHPRLPHPSSASISTAQSPPTVRNSSMQQEPPTVTNVFMKKQQQQRELYLLKKQHQLLKQNHQQTMPRAHPAHQQPPSLSGQVYQPQPIPPLVFDQRLQPGPSDFSHPPLFLSPIHVSTTSTAPSSPAQLTVTQSSSPSRPSKGVHKRSSSLYQCPYCPVLVTLKALEVASHIQQNHTGKQVAFRKIA